MQLSLNSARPIKPATVAKANMVMTWMKGRGKGQRKRATEVCEAVRGTELLTTIGLSLENVMDA